MLYNHTHYLGLHKMNSTASKIKQNPTATKELKESEVFYRHLAELSPMAIVIHSMGKIVFANPKAVSLVRAKSASEIIGRNILDFIHPESKKLAITRLQLLMQNKKIDDVVEEKFLDIKGNVIIAEVRSVRFVFQGMPAILSIFYDITESKEIKEKMQQNEERFRSLIENSADAIALINPTGKLLYISSSIERILGYTPKEFMSKNCFSYFHPKDLSLVAKNMTQILLKPNSSATTDVRVKHKNGSWRWLRTAGTNCLTNPAINAIVVNLHDVTDIRKAQTRHQILEQASNLLISSIDYKTTLNNVADLIVPTLADYCRIAILEDGQTKDVAMRHVNPRKLEKVKRLNAKYRELDNTKYGISSILKTGKVEIITDIEKDYLPTIKEKKLVEILKGLEFRSYMGIPLNARGKTIGAITFLYTQKDHFYSRDDLELALDLAHHIALAIDNAKLFANEQQAVSLRDNFISLASHELKTPLTSLKLYIQILNLQSAKHGNKEYSHYYEKIDTQLDKLTMLIGDLLNVSKLQHGKLEFRNEYFYLPELVKEAVEVAQATTRKHKIFVAGTVEKKVFADRYRIYQVLTNLLTNAIKYSPKADKIIVKLKPQAEYVVVTIKDFGIGIDSEHKSKIFGQFYRIDTPEERTYPGLGMGLFISNEIVKSHGGSFSVRSKKGKGSEFSFTLPYNK